MTHEEVLNLTLEASNGKMLKNGEMWWAMNSNAAFKLADAIAQREREQYEGVIRELLEALRICSGFVEAFGEPEIRAMVRETIAKARGEA